MGAAIARALAADNVSVFLIGRDVDALEEIASIARGFGVEATWYEADLANESDQLELTRRLVEDFPHLDVLIQNAGIYQPGSIESATIEDLDRHYRVNVRAPYALTQALLPALKARQGQVVFINSSNGLGAKPRSAQYDATKHALRAIADSLRGEVNGAGVRVLSVYLGRTATSMQARIHAADAAVYQPEFLLQPDDVASVILNAINLPRTAEVTDIQIRPMVDQRRKCHLEESSIPAEHATPLRMRSI